MTHQTVRRNLSRRMGLHGQPQRIAWHITLACALIWSLSACGADADATLTPTTDAGSVDGASADGGQIGADSGQGGADSTQGGADSSQGGADADGSLCGDNAGLSRPTHWTAASHCKGAAPDYAKLFDDTKVQRLDITISPETAKSMTADLTSKLSQGGGPGATTKTPAWAGVTVRHDGKLWEHVGMRYKGNSSLKFAWKQGVKKLSFRLTFDKYEDDHPELDNQRFYGFKKMTFSNGFKDDSLIRDKLAADIFREGGVPAARTGFVRIYIDTGDGPVYFGLYTMIEDPSNKMLDTQFSDDSGNLYKPDGKGARWGSFVEADFEKKTNEDEADFSDIKAAITALHADRKTDPAAWRAGLEAVFKVNMFLKWLAINQAMQNWDTYGVMTHNYYVYGDPADKGRLQWMPWDLNESMLSGGKGGNAEVMLTSVSSSWPLIRFLLDDAVYLKTYKKELKAAIEGAFSLAKVHAKMDAFHALIAPYVTGADGEKAPYTFLKNSSAFTTSLTGSKNALKSHVTSRHALVKQALGL